MIEIKLYPLPRDCCDTTKAQPIETHEWEGTLRTWLEHHEIPIDEFRTQPIEVFCGDRELRPECWGEPMEGEVCLFILPNGGVLNSIGNILGKLFNTIFGFLLPSRAGQDSNQPQQGERLETSEGRVNQARLGQRVPELFGRYRRNPDYATPPYRRFDNWREQRLRFHAVVGPGSYLIHDQDVKVGDTPLSSLGEDGAYQLFSPGADVSGVDTHEHWHTVPAVGGTSSGTAGLEMSTEEANRENTQPASYSFDGSYIRRSSESEFPPGWGAGTLVNIYFPQQFEVSRPDVPLPQPQRNRFTGAFKHLLPLGGLGVALTMEYSGQRHNVFVDSMSLDENGDGWIELTLPQENPEDPVNWVNFVPLGQQTLVFQRDPAPRYSIQQYSSDNIVVWRLLPNGNNDPDWRGFPQLTSSEATVTFNGGKVYGGWTSEFVATPGDETTTIFEVDFFFPQGLGFIRDNGDVDLQSLGIEIQYRNVDGGPRTTVSKWYTQSTLDQIGITERIQIPRMRPAVRVRRVGTGATKPEVKHEIQWYGLKSNLPTRTSYPNWTTMAVWLRSGGRLGAQSENQINLIATRILPTMQWDGSFGAPQPTRDISAAFRHIALSLGYTDADLDVPELLRLHNTWTSRGDTFDYVFDAGNARDNINKVLGAGFASLTLHNGLLRPVRDEPRTQWEQPFSPHNMVGPLRRGFNANRLDDYDGVDVEYMDEESWTKQTVECRLPGDAGAKVKKVRLDGVTNRDKAWRHGMRERLILKYRVWTYSFGTEMSAFNCRRLSYVCLFDDIPGYGKAALITRVTPLSGGRFLLKSSEKLPWEEGANHIVAWRAPDGRILGPFSATRGSRDDEVVVQLGVEIPKVTLAMDLPHLYFGTSERFSFPALIETITPEGRFNAKVTATNYDERIYQYY